MSRLAFHPVGGLCRLQRGGICGCGECHGERAVVGWAYEWPKLVPRQEFGDTGYKIDHVVCRVVNASFAPVTDSKLASCSAILLFSPSTATTDTPMSLKRKNASDINSSQKKARSNFFAPRSSVLAGESKGSATPMFTYTRKAAATARLVTWNVNGVKSLDEKVVFVCYSFT